MKANHPYWQSAAVYIAEHSGAPMRQGKDIHFVFFYVETYLNLLFITIGVFVFTLHILCTYMFKFVKSCFKTFSWSHKVTGVPSAATF